MGYGAMGLWAMGYGLWGYGAMGYSSRYCFPLTEKRRFGPRHRPSPTGNSLPPRDLTRA